MRVVLALVWLGVIGGAALAGVQLAATLESANSAPQQAAGAALAACYAVIPYVGARAVQGLAALGGGGAPAESASRGSETQPDEE